MVHWADFRGVALAATIGASVAAVTVALASRAATPVARAASFAEDDGDADPAAAIKLASRSSRAASSTNSKCVQKFVLTGGPCGGKTTALARLRTFLEERGFRVFIAAEAATFLWSNGVQPRDNCAEDDGWINFQIHLMQTQMHFEDLFTERAKIACAAAGEDQHAIVLCDRGTMDGKAYIDEDSWKTLLERQGLDEVTIRDARYDAVLHMTTAAAGAEAFYTSANNATRTEDPPAARALDDRIRDAWLGHPRHSVFTNDAKENGGAGFEAKMRSLIDQVSVLLGLPTTRRKAQKFLLKANVFPADFAAAGVATRVFQIEKLYPLTPGVSATDESKGFTYVRRRQEVGDNAGGFASYGETRVTFREGERIEMKRVLSHREYGIAASLADPSRHVVRTVRTCFMLGRNSFYIESFVVPRKGLTLMYAQSTPGGDGLDVHTFPAFIRKMVEREVTGLKEYTSRNISTRMNMGKH